MTLGPYTCWKAKPNKTTNNQPRRDFVFNHVSSKHPLAMTNSEKFPRQTVSLIGCYNPFGRSSTTQYWLLKRKQSLSINLIVVLLDKTCTHILGYAVYTLYRRLTCAPVCVWRLRGTRRNVGDRLLVTGLQNTPRVEVVFYFSATFASRVAFSSRVRAFSRNKSTCRLPCWKMFFLLIPLVHFNAPNVHCRVTRFALRRCSKKS